MGLRRPQCPSDASSSLSFLKEAPSVGGKHGDCCGLQCLEDLDFQWSENTASFNLLNERLKISELLLYFLEAIL